MKEIKLSDTQVVDLLKSEVPWNRARRAFAISIAKLSAMEVEKLSPLELRRWEFIEVAEIARQLGVMVVAPLDPAAPLDPPGPSPWGAGADAPERASGASGTLPPAPGREAPLGPENVDKGPFEGPGPGPTGSRPTSPG